MTDAVHNQQPHAPTAENPLQSLYNDFMHGIDKLTGKTEQPQQKAPESQGPLQLMPEIHGNPGKNAGQAPAKDGTVHKPADTHTDARTTAPAKPKDHAPPTQQALADKTLNAIAKADLRNYAQPSQEAQDVVRGFLAERKQLPAKDKADALKHFQPGFNLAIRNADSAYIKAEQENSSQIKSAKIGYISANSAYQANFKDTVKVAEQMKPGPEQQSAARLLAQVGVNGKEMPKKEELTSVFKTSPEVLHHLLELVDSQKSVFKADKDLATATKPVIDAALEQERTRLAYERAAQSVGKNGLAKSIDDERGMLAERTRALTAAPEVIVPLTKA